MTHSGHSPVDKARHVAGVQMPRVSADPLMPDGRARGPRRLPASSVSCSRAAVCGEAYVRSPPSSNTHRAAGTQQEQGSCTGAVGSHKCPHGKGQVQARPPVSSHSVTLSALAGVGTSRRPPGFPQRRGQVHRGDSPAGNSDRPRRPAPLPRKVQGPRESSKHSPAGPRGITEAPPGGHAGRGMGVAGAPEACGLAAGPGLPPEQRPGGCVTEAKGHPGPAGSSLRIQRASRAVRPGRKRFPQEQPRGTSVAVDPRAGVTYPRHSHEPRAVMLSVSNNLCGGRYPPTS